MVSQLQLFFLWWEISRFTQQLSNIQFSIFNYSHHAAPYIPRTNLSYNWKLVPYDAFTHTTPPPHLWQPRICSLYLSSLFHFFKILLLSKIARYLSFFARQSPGLWRRLPDRSWALGQGANSLGDPSGRKPGRRPPRPPPSLHLPVMLPRRGSLVPSPPAHRAGGAGWGSRWMCPGQRPTVWHLQ